MRSLWVTLVLAASVVLALPLAAGAVGLDVEANGGAGIGLGSTNNPNETGAPRAAFQGGVEADLFLFSAGPVDLGLSTGVEYSNLTLHGVLTIPTLTTETADSTYVYLVFPLAITSRIPLSEGLNLSLRAGGFFAYFLGGSANVSFNPQFGPFVNGTVNLDSSNVPWMAYGLHFTGGADISLGGGLFLSPSIIFNMGLTNTNGNDSNGYTSGSNTYKDTLWSLTGMIGLKYNVF